MAIADALATYARRISFEALGAPLVDALKIRVLDALGCAIGALTADTPHLVRQHVDVLGGGPCVPPDRRRRERPRPRRALQRLARTLPRLQRQLLRQGGDLPSERQPRRAGCVLCEHW